MISQLTQAFLHRINGIIYENTPACKALELPASGDCCVKMPLENHNGKQRLKTRLISDGDSVVRKRDDNDGPILVLPDYPA